MKTLNDLGLCKKSRKKVEEWLQEWLDLFIKQANGKQGWPYRADFENDDFFFFTDCKDILEKDPEAKGQENNLAIRSRKRKVLLQLFVKTLMGKKNICDNIKCGHCGFTPCWIESLGDGTGHWTYCPKCTKLEVQVFPGGFDTCMDKIKSMITKRLLPLDIKIDPKCIDLINEIHSYKYTKKAFKKFEAAFDEVKVIIKPDPRLKDVITEKRKVPKLAWSAMLPKDNKKCSKCKHKMTPVQTTADAYLGFVEGWQCPKCKYKVAKK